ncbi:uncharacterized protein LOC115481788 [Microcaecilia unicolor]|uniref:Uncharacterized protein LOC115481788 n=1 Tax=Microcaecilia unicolor TaxID=1415580 RepID=A0A6P7ZGJ2_9AMPH|nr:uncharacterized protein LOC115481788 [Microcaecilia unicolor]
MYSVTSTLGYNLKGKLIQLYSDLTNDNKISRVPKEVLALIFCEPLRKTGNGSRSGKPADLNNDEQSTDSNNEECEPTGLQKKSEILIEDVTHTQKEISYALDERDGVLQHPSSSSGSNRNSPGNGRNGEAKQALLDDSVCVSFLEGSIQECESERRNGYRETGIQERKEPESKPVPQNASRGHPRQNTRQTRINPRQLLPEIKKWLSEKDIKIENVRCINTREHKVYSCMTAKDIVLFRRERSDPWKILRILKPKEKLNNKLPRKNLEFELKFNMAVIGENIHQAHIISEHEVYVIYDNSFEFEKHFETVMNEILLPLLALYKKMERTHLIDEVSDPI